MTTVDTSSEDLIEIIDSGLKVWKLPSVRGRPCLNSFREKCAKERLCGVLIEGGTCLMSSFLIYKELDYLFAYRAPKIMADAKAKDSFIGLTVDKIDECISLSNVKHDILGDDQLMRGYIEYQ